MSERETVTLALSLYDEGVLQRAIEAYQDFCDITYDRADRHLRVRVVPHQEVPHYVVDEFLSYVLAGSLELRLAGDAW